MMDHLGDHDLLRHGSYGSFDDVCNAIGNIDSRIDGVEQKLDMAIRLLADTRDSIEGVALFLLGGFFFVVIILAAHVWHHW